MTDPVYSISSGPLPDLMAKIESYRVNGLRFIRINSLPPDVSMALEERLNSSVAALTLAVLANPTPAPVEPIQEPFVTPKLTPVFAPFNVNAPTPDLTPTVPAPAPAGAPAPAPAPAGAPAPAPAPAPAGAPAPAPASARSSLILKSMFNGINGSTTFADYYGATIERAGSGNTAISTAQAKFGTGSLYIDGTPLVITDSVGKDKYNFPGQYTLQLWVYLLAGITLPANGVDLFSRADNVDGRSEYSFKMRSLTQLGLYRGARGSSETNYSATVPALTTGWNHIAFTRDESNVMKFFANGVLGTGANSTPTDGSALGDSLNHVYVGGFFPPYGVAQGLYMYSLEVDKGACLYTASFTPPTQQT